ncbi:hypothetical protein L596_018035 [Steinernema carpocapsae]|uniref:Uncharacterized protein n=1 Tax=Steinernema carpocapsae TaxID=34508 RepID=A0A4U5N3P8_STECR|nr:hypothetical protein L596_018035 [Steinernema carpocapsae]
MGFWEVESERQNSILGIKELDRAVGKLKSYRSQISPIKAQPLYDLCPKLFYDKQRPTFKAPRLVTIN